MNERRIPPPRAPWTLLLVILLMAASLRFWQLNRVPPGLTHDEANNVHDAAAVLDGLRPAYFPVAQGKEPLYPYSVALTMAFLGRSPWTVRLTSAFWGLLLVALSYAWIRRAFGPGVALLTAAGLAVGHWPVTTSRMGLRAITLPVLFTATVYFLWRGMGAGDAEGRSASKRTDVRFFLLAGLALGAAQYTYLAARLMPLVLVLFFLYRALWHKRVERGLLLTLGVAAIVAAPLFLYLGAHPSAEIRIGQLDQPLRDLLAGDAAPLLDRARGTLLMFSFRGDTFIPYNLPGKPLFDPLMSVLFYVGLLVALRRWRRPAYALALLWLIVGFAPALVVGVEGANLRAIAAQPALYLFPALSLQALGRYLQKRGLSRRRTMWAAVALFALVGGLTYRDYFVRWAEDRDVRVHYHVDLVAIADYVETHPARAVAISALYPGEYHDPRVVEAYLGKEAHHLRWMDGRGALVLPATGQALWIVPAAVPLAPSLASLLPTEEGPQERVTVRARDFNPTFDVYAGAQPGRGVDPSLARFGDTLSLLDTNRPASLLAAGQVLELVTTWQIDGRLPPEREAVLFAQLLDPQGNVVAQQDRLDAPSWNWHPGDRFVQRLRLSLPTDLAPGTYRLILGVYTRPDRVDAVLAGREPEPAMPRLPVVVDGASRGDFVELAPVEVVADD